MGYFGHIINFLPLNFSQIELGFFIRYFNNICRNPLDHSGPRVHFKTSCNISMIQLWSSSGAVDRIKPRRMEIWTFNIYILHITRWKQTHTTVPQCRKSVNRATFGPGQYYEKNPTSPPPPPNTFSSDLAHFFSFH